MTGLGHKYSLLISIIVLLMLGGAIGWYFLEYKTDKSHIRVGGHQLQVDIADDEAERAQGLSGRTQLGPRTGMLFVFEDGQDTCIWMKDMKFSLDIIWFDSKGIIIDTRSHVSPDTYPETFCPRSPAKYVLELPAGSIDGLGFQHHITELEAVAF